MPLRSMPLDGLRALYFFKNILFIFKKEGETDRQTAGAGGPEGEGERISSKLHAELEPHERLDSMT